MTAEEMKARQAEDNRKEAERRETADQSYAVDLVEAYAPMRKAMNALQCEAQSMAGRQIAQRLAVIRGQLDDLVNAASLICPADPEAARAPNG